MNNMNIYDDAAAQAQRADRQSYVRDVSMERTRRTHYTTYEHE